ncbi:winged helix-turn-helix transcriptional regulator [Phytohabitans kaempferiae]|uniref:Winged helix-turn-helix transcriptional regulator n=1 Tax=Phytohabitans kaempferiae TaxID=1620943 RepID=A0ABV6LXH6_9ACTN
MVLQLAGRLADRGDVPLGDHCPIDRALHALANRPAILLLREVFYGVSRFDPLVKRVGVTEAVAAQRLRELVAIGVLAKRPYREPGQRTRHEYVLTDRGRELSPIVLGLLSWGETHLPDDRGSVAMTHAGCDAAVRISLHCEAGHELREDEVVVTGNTAEGG